MFGSCSVCVSDDDDDGGERSGQTRRPSPSLQSFLFFPFFFFPFPRTQKQKEMKVWCEGVIEEFKFKLSLRLCLLSCIICNDEGKERRRKFTNHSLTLFVNCHPLSG